MVERDRVRKAVEQPVADAVKLLDEARDADTETRLTMLINGWGRGLAAGLEELAVAIDELQRRSSPESSSQAADEVMREPADVPKAAHPTASAEPDEEEIDEERLRARAAESRAATAALREEASSVRDDDRLTNND